MVKPESPLLAVLAPGTHSPRMAISARPEQDWRNAPSKEWKNARWYNGIDAAQTADEDKTIICGHWHASYGHSKYEGKGSAFGADADFTPYYGSHVIAIDACTAYSGKVNCIVVED